MSNLYTITETILSTSSLDLDAFVASSLQTWTYTTEEHAQLAFSSVANELKAAYPKGQDGEFTIQHQFSPTEIIIKIMEAGTLAETITLAFHAHDTRLPTWWQNLASGHQEQVTARFPAQPTQFVVTKSLISGHSAKDDDGFASTLQTWTYEKQTDAATDFEVLVSELETTYPLGMHDDGFEVTLATMSDDTCSIVITQDGEPYETIVVEQLAVTAKSLPTWWHVHEQNVIKKW
ncbi:MAG: hypothetical protein ACRC1D_00435 [Culicoidibacterales bacterium]